MAQAAIGRGGYTTAGSARGEARISVSSSVRLKNDTIDLNGRVIQDTPRRHRTQAEVLDRMETEEKQKKLQEQLAKERTRRGKRVDMAGGLAILFAILIAGIILCLIFTGNNTDLRKKTERIEKQIADVRSVNRDLSAKVEEATSERTICYAAARQLNMIPADAAEAIHLSAVDTRPAASAHADINPVLSAQALH